jgi:hypothetical protein
VPDDHGRQRLQVAERDKVPAKTIEYNARRVDNGPLDSLPSKKSKKKDVRQPPTAKPLKIVAAPGEQLPGLWQREAAFSEKQLAELYPTVKRLTEKVRKVETLAARLNERCMVNACGQAWSAGGASALVHRLGFELGRRAARLRKLSTARAPSPQAMYDIIISPLPCVGRTRKSSK